MNTPADQHLTNLCRIAQGLLASGHYTEIDKGGFPALMRTLERNSFRNYPTVVLDSAVVYSDLVKIARESWRET